VRRRRGAGWLLLVSGLLTGALAWFVAWATYYPGFGFESWTIGAALIGTSSVAAIAIAAVLLGRPVVLSVLCVVAAILMAVSISQLAHDIPGATARDIPAYDDEYRSRLHALWLGGLSAIALLVVGVIGLWRRRDVASAS
jgi:hypothetical protein